MFEFTRVQITNETKPVELTQFDGKEVKLLLHFERPKFYEGKMSVNGTCFTVGENEFDLSKIVFPKINGKISGAGCVTLVPTGNLKEREELIGEWGLSIQTENNAFPWHAIAPNGRKLIGRKTLFEAIEVAESYIAYHKLNRI